jgi:hypothetical protein
MQIIDCQFQTFGFQSGNNEFGLNENFKSELEQSLRQVSFPTPENRIQFKLSQEIIQKFTMDFEYFNTRHENILCDERLNYKYDGCFLLEKYRIGVEIQFRPDFLKDVARFQMGFYRERIKAMIYIVATDRTTINHTYTTMPEFGQVTSHLDLLNWLEVPVLVIGINCNNNDQNAH